MDKNEYINLEKLEYNLILEKLSLFCKTYLGKAFCVSLKPSSNDVEVQKMLKETDEAFIYIIRKGNIPLYDISDISISLKSLDSYNSINAKALLDIGNIFKLSRELKEYFNLDDLDETDFSTIFNYFNNLYTNLDIEKLILNSIIDENTISDTASQKLSSIRKEKKKIEIDIKDTLNKILRSSTYSNAIMEQIVTIRNDRYVIPIKEEFKGSIKGFIHDVSASGSTLFIEPMQAFELNNKLQELKVEENIEIDKILKDLSIKVAQYTKELQNNVNLIRIIDFIFAKASYAKSIDAICPIINKEKKIELYSARHPLLDSNTVVPIDVSIGTNYTSLIITGPNTGGKTVTLKTVGLLTAMACSGLFIPANEKSSIYVFDNIFADIGDEQSIEESLSTFSSHIVNIINILNNSTENSLILLDELGSGTDPIEGAALAISLLEHFNKQGALTIATTHYHEIKNYALVTNGFENASSGFDVETLTPTYKLLIGVPGKSNAFEISKRLGLDSLILEKAKSLLDKDEISIEELLKNIYDDKLNAHNDLIEIEKNKNQIENIRKSLEQEKQNQKESKNIELEKAKVKAKDIVIDTKEKANDIINELNDMYNDFKALEDIDFETWSDTEIANFVKIHFNKNILKNANSIRTNYNKDINLLDKKEEHSTTLDKSQLIIGASVKLSNFNELGSILSLPNKQNKIQVQIGSAKMYIDISDIIEIIDKPINNTKKSQVSSPNTFKAKSISTEINVIGQNIEEACFVIDKYLDNCALAKVSPVRIVHGKGSGKLREGIHKFLSSHPHVQSYRIGTFGEGEMGVTIVEIKK